MIEHDLLPHFPALRLFDSTPALERSPLWAEIGPEVRRVLATVVRGGFATAPAPVAAPPHPAGAAPVGARVRAVAWNIERGIQLKGIIRALEEHPRLRDADVLLLTELDIGMARTRNLDVPREIARALGLDYAFVPIYVSLVKGSGLEVEAAGENSLALHGNAILSRWPLREAHALALPNGKDLMRGKEKRLGWQQAVVADLEHPGGPVRVVSLHIDAHSSQRHRARQMRQVLDHLARLDRDAPRPALIGGDWNTCTYDSSRALWSILGYFRRVAMGVRNVVENHYPYPERWFERHLFRLLDRRGWAWRDLNVPGGCTYHYDMMDPAVNTNLGDWVPAWCFPFIRWAVGRVGGRCSLKLDWFTARGLVRAPGGLADVVGDVHPPDLRLSDHEPIVVDLVRA